MKITSSTLLLLSSAFGAAGAFSTTSCRATSAGCSSTSLNAAPSSRRSWLTSSSSILLGSAIAATASNPQAAFAKTVTNAASLDPDLPNDAIKSYLQYRYSLQLAADYYIFDLQNMVADTDEYGLVTELVRSSNARGGQGQPSRIERDYVNPMRIMGLSLPPEYADDVRDTQFAFERAMSKLNKATQGIKRDLSVEIDKNAVPNAKAAWEEGRVALNSFFAILNTATGLKDELKLIPPSGPNQVAEYGRSIRRYNEFMKKTKLCQNRGGPALSQAWGQLMVSGYLQDSCGVEPMDQYFFQ